jgi:hypothetical protein
MVMQLLTPLTSALGHRLQNKPTAKDVRGLSAMMTAMASSTRMMHVH